MVLYTAGIQILTRIYNVLFIEGSLEKYNKNLNLSLLKKQIL